MTIPTSGTYLKGVYGLSRALGNRLTSSDFTFEIVGQEQLGLLFKGFSLPFLTPGDGIEVPLPLGAAQWQPSQLEVHKQSPVNVMETVLGHFEKFLQSVVSDLKNPGRFDVKIYSGTPDQYYRVWTLRDAFLKVEPADIDMEARNQLLNISGTLYYMYFGEVKPGPLSLGV